MINIIRQVFLTFSIVLSLIFAAIDYETNTTKSIFWLGVAIFNQLQYSDLNRK